MTFLQVCVCEWVSVWWVCRADVRSFCTQYFVTLFIHSFTLEHLSTSRTHSTISIFNRCVFHYEYVCVEHSLLNPSPTVLEIVHYYSYYWCTCPMAPSYLRLWLHNAADSSDGCPPSPERWVAPFPSQSAPLLSIGLTHHCRSDRWENGLA